MPENKILMKSGGGYVKGLKWLLIIALVCMHTFELSAQCNQNYIYGLTNVGKIQRIDVTNGAVATAINPAYPGNAANLSNAMGYNPLNGKYYYFKRNTLTAPQEFVSFDPATNLYSILASAPISSTDIINLGCVNQTGLGYYCLDALGTLYFYNVASNKWVTICSNIKDQFGTTLSSIIGAGSLNRYYGDIAFDATGSLWILVSGASDYGLYKISGPLPTKAVSYLKETQLIAPNTASPAGTFGGIAFSSTGTLYISSNSPSNKLYQLTSLNSLNYVATFTVDGIGNDLTSCNFPLSILASTGVKLSANIVNNNTAVLNWNVLETTDNTGYGVEYSEDGMAWKEIHFALKRPDDLSATYTFSEANLPAGVNYYRIRKTDQNGSVAYSNIEKLAVASAATINVWPNPAQDVLKLESKTTVSGTARIILSDESGRMLGGLTLTSGINNIPVSALRPGTYIVSVRYSNGQVFNQKFIKQ